MRIDLRVRVKMDSCVHEKVSKDFEGIFWFYVQEFAFEKVIVFEQSF